MMQNATGRSMQTKVEELFYKHSKTASAHPLYPLRVRTLSNAASAKYDERTIGALAQ